MIKGIQPGTFFFTGIIIIPSFVFAESLTARTVLFAAIIILNMITGRNFRILPSVILASGVILANLYPPGGRVYFTAGPFYVTHDALMTGIRKTLLLAGTVYISRFSIRRELVFPGRAGALLYKTFYYFEKLTEMKLDIRNNIIMQIDNRLSEIDSTSRDVGMEGHTLRLIMEKKNLFFLILVSLLFWGTFFFSEIYLRRG